MAARLNAPLLTPEEVMVIFLGSRSNSPRRSLMPVTTLAPKVSVSAEETSTKPPHVLYWLLYFVTLESI